MRPAVGARTDPLSPFGSRFLPGTAVVNERENVVRGRVNNLGFHDRDVDLDLDPSVRRIGFFGDSFVEALQVEEDSSFASRLEDRARAAGIPLDAAAFGLSGSGADQSLFRSLHALEQVRLDDVVYVFFWNDFFDGFDESAKPRTWPFVKRDPRGAYYFSGAYQHDRGPRGLAACARDAAKRLYLPAFLSYRLFKLRAQREAREGTDPARDDRALGLFAKGDSVPEAHRAARDHWEEVVRHWRDVCRARGVVFRVLYMPVEWETDDSTYAATFGGAVPRAGLASWVGAFCEREGIPFIDPTAAFVAATGGRGRDLYWGHLNYAGHRVLADTLFAALCAPGGR